MPKIWHNIGLKIVLLCILSSKVVGEAPGVKENTGALTLVPDQDDDSEDGVVTVEENGNSETDIENIDPMNVFRPTNEWKSVKPGQAIPPGLHVRMNLQTGEREAKLIDDDKGIKYWESDGKRGMVNTGKKHFTRDELKRALKDFKLETAFEDPEHTKKVKSKFKTYEELKKDFEKINMNIKTEGEIVEELFTRLNSTGLDQTEKKTILTDLEYYLHQIDNARLFSDLGGMHLLLHCLNDSNEAIRSEAVLVLGSSMQSNPKVQIAAMDTGILQPLLRMLVLETSTTVQKRVLFAISSLVRQFPFAQQQLLNHGGLSALANFITHPGNSNLGVRSVTLISDLLKEQELASLNRDPSDGIQTERLKQYSQLGLQSALVDQGWCDLVTGLLDANDHDTREKVLEAMHVMLPLCKSSFQHALPNLNHLKQEYSLLSKSDPEDDFFKTVFLTLTAITKQLSVKEEL